MSLDIYCISSSFSQETEDDLILGVDYIKRRLLRAVEVVSLLRVSKFYGQATKGARWMPWQKQAMKDAASCDKLRGAAHTL